MVIGLQTVRPQPLGALDLDRRLDRGDGASERDDGAVALQIDEASAVALEDRLDHLPAQPLEALKGGGLVTLHEPAVAGDVRRHDGRPAAPRARRSGLSVPVGIGPWLRSSLPVPHDPPPGGSS